MTPLYYRAWTRRMVRDNERIGPKALLVGLIMGSQADWRTNTLTLWSDYIGKRIDCPPADVTGLAGALVALDYLTDLHKTDPLGRQIFAMKLPPSRDERRAARDQQMKGTDE